MASPVRALVLLVVALATVLSGCYDPADTAYPDQPYGLTVIVESLDGSPLRYAEVVVVSEKDDILVGLTDADGKATFQLQRHQNATFGVMLDGWVTVDTPLFSIQLLSAWAEGFDTLGCAFSPTFSCASVHRDMDGKSTNATVVMIPTEIHRSWESPIANHVSLTVGGPSSDDWFATEVPLDNDTRRGSFLHQHLDRVATSMAWTNGPAGGAEAELAFGCTREAFTSATDEGFPGQMPALGPHNRSLSWDIPADGWPPYVSAVDSPETDGCSQPWVGPVVKGVVGTVETSGEVVFTFGPRLQIPRYVETP